MARRRAPRQAPRARPPRKRGDVRKSRLKQIVYFKRPITHKNGPGNVLYQRFETNGAFSNGCFRTFLAEALNAPGALHWKTPSRFLGPAPRAGFEPPRDKQNARASLTWATCSRATWPRRVNKNARALLLLALSLYGGSSGVRTLGLGIKSPLLCQLS